MTRADAAPQMLIRNLEDQRYQAVLEHDFDAFVNLCHERLVYSHSGGNRDSLESYVGKLRSGALRYDRIDRTIDKVLIVGGTALVLGQMKADVTVNGQPKTLNNSSLAVWVDDDSGHWKFIAYQPTPQKTGA